MVIVKKMMRIKLSFHASKNYFSFQLTKIFNRRYKILKSIGSEYSVTKIIDGSAKCQDSHS